MKEPQKTNNSNQDVLGFDIGGANTKVVLARVTGSSIELRAHALRYYPIWQKSKNELPVMLSEIAQDVGYADGDSVCAAITAELSDAYETKREGILHVLSSLQQVFPTATIQIFTTPGFFQPPEAILLDPLPAAAANWVATARWVSSTCPDCILIDIGSTTVDIIPIVNGQVAAQGRTDLTRLLHGELVYTGVLRATIPSVACQVPFRGQQCPISFEKFATIADVHLILGTITENQYTTETADGRPPTLEYAYARLARIVCAD
ncbi:MAG TPA: hydantoinase/oxoprolinase family protein, partial [Candidatus Lokiarchaeia archaeon]|nr:hydantoinase/oxoprolinase family protein [Candidatus Lokiarchaeia archaeon]